MYILLVLITSGKIDNRNANDFNQAVSNIINQLSYAASIPQNEMFMLMQCLVQHVKLVDCSVYDAADLTCAF